MKYIKVVIVFCLLTLTGCQNKQEELNKQKLEEYTAVVESVLASNTKNSSSTTFSVSTEVSKLEDGSFRYYIIVDNPVVCMNDVRVLVVDLDSDFSKTMAPSIGIIDDVEYNLVPSQVSLEEGYVRGLVLSGDSQEAQINLKLVVSWFDENNTQHKEYLALQCNYIEDIEG